MVDNEEEEVGQVKAAAASSDPSRTVNQMNATDRLSMRVSLDAERERGEPFVRCHVLLARVRII